MTTRVLMLHPKNRENLNPEPDHINLQWPERYISVIAGIRIGYSGFKHLFSAPFSGILKLGAGGYLLNRGITGHCELYERLGKYINNPVNVNIRSSFIIHKPRHEVYAFWRRFDNLPLFMKHLKSVELLENDHSRWVLRLPTGVARVSWESQIVKDKPNVLIGWSSLPGSIIENAGKVRFRDTIDGEGTRVDVTISYRPPAGSFGAGLAWLLNPIFKNMVEKDVQNFKHYMDIDYATDSINYL